MTTEQDVGILTARIREITELMVDFNWDRTPEHIRRLSEERDRLQVKRRELLHGDNR